MKGSSLVLTAAGLFAVALTSAGSGTLAAAAGPSGELVFRQRCQICHSVTPAHPNKLGPDLRGVVGRKAASTGFDYSPALKRSGLTWTQANLDTFLAGPT